MIYKSVNYNQPTMTQVIEFNLGMIPDVHTAPIYPVGCGNSAPMAHLLTPDEFSVWQNYADFDPYVDVDRIYIPSTPQFFLFSHASQWSTIGLFLWFIRLVIHWDMIIRYSLGKKSNSWALVYSTFFAMYSPASVLLGFPWIMKRVDYGIPVFLTVMSHCCYIEQDIFTFNIMVLSCLIYYFNLEIISKVGEDESGEDESGEDESGEYESSIDIWTGRLRSKVPEYI
jgi:hypothetical protein